MMKILSVSQIYEADQATMNRLPISSTDLMEKAARACFDWISEQLPNRSRTVRVFCGMGNNGGDGLVIARLLLEKGYQVHTYLVCFTEKRSADFKVNLERLEALDACILEIRSQADFPSIDREDLIVDAIFGIGLKRTVTGFTSALIQLLNHAEATIIAIDIPSGLFAESAVEDPRAVMRATYTLSFQVPKLAFFMPENQDFVENWQILDIELDKAYLSEVRSAYQLIDKNLIKQYYKKRKKFSHKGSYGHSLLIGGSFGKIGAMILASYAALRVGSGLVSVYIPKCGYTAMQTSNPEVMVEVDSEKYIEFFNVKTRPQAIGIGPGLGTHVKTKQGFVEFIERCKVPLVLDADALNIVSESAELFRIIPKGSVLTPHPKEFERLVGAWANDYEKIEKLKHLSSSLESVVVLKGAYTAIAHQGNIYFNATGNPGLATAGSGDVLTGMIAGLLAQGYMALEAAVLGVYMHGRTADIGLEFSESAESFTAGDCVKFLGRVFKELN